MADLTLTLIGSQLVAPDQRTRLYWGSDNALYQNTGTTFAPTKVSTGSDGSQESVTITAGDGINVTGNGSVYTVAIDTTVVTAVTASEPLSVTRTGNQVSLSLNTTGLVTGVNVSGGLLTKSTTGSTTTIGLSKDAIGITLTGDSSITTTKTAWNAFTLSLNNVVKSVNGVAPDTNGAVTLTAANTDFITGTTVTAAISAHDNNTDAHATVLSDIREKIKYWMPNYAAGVDKIRDVIYQATEDGWVFLNFHSNGSNETDTDWTGIKVGQQSDLSDALEHTYLGFGGYLRQTIMVPVCKGWYYSASVRYQESDGTQHPYVMKFLPMMASEDLN